MLTRASSSGSIDFSNVLVRRSFLLVENKERE
jgi:hypothetical protein